MLPRFINQIIKLNVGYAGIRFTYYITVMAL